MNTLLLSLGGGAIVNIVAIALIALFAIFGLAKGFTKTVLKTFGTIAAILIAILLCGKIAVFLEP